MFEKKKKEDKEITDWEARTNLMPTGRTFFFSGPINHRSMPTTDQIDQFHRYIELHNVKKIM